MPYDELLVKPMREELVSLGFEELKSADEVDGAIDNSQGTVLLFVNSVCGCAAGMARPGAAMAMNNSKLPSRLTTVFAGQDFEAVEKARSLLAEFPPSSPSIALFRDGEVVWFLPRHGIEGHSAEQVAEKITQAFNEYC